MALLAFLGLTTELWHDLIKRFVDIFSLSGAAKKKLERTRDFKQESRQEAFPSDVSSEDTVVGFVSVDKTGPSLKVRAVVSD